MREMPRSNEFSEIPVIILCGGKGVMLDEENNKRKNKALIQVNGKPLMYWVMQTYALHGASKFIISAGFQWEIFGESLEKTGAKKGEGAGSLYIMDLAGVSCRVQLVKTREDASTGGRLIGCRDALTRFGEYKDFAVTYSDTLSDVDLEAEMKFHKKQDLIATMVAAKLPVRFRVLGIRSGEVLVRGFASRPVIEAASINGGYYIFKSTFWDQTGRIDDLVALENEPLEQLASSGQLAAYEHKGDWQTCDAERDLKTLEYIARKISKSLER